MAAQVLMRKQQHNQPGNHRTTAARVSPQDPLHLLNNPDKGLKARKELLMSALRGSGDGASTRVAAVKEELAGVQARLRDALGLRESSASGQSVLDEVGMQPAYECLVMQVGLCTNSYIHSAESQGQPTHDLENKCLTNCMEELQAGFACRMHRIPLVPR
jgi:hypothetical protein